MGSGPGGGLRDRSHDQDLGQLSLRVRLRRDWGSSSLSSVTNNSIKSMKKTTD